MPPASITTSPRWSVEELAEDHPPQFNTLPRTPEKSARSKVVPAPAKPTMNGLIKATSAPSGAVGGAQALGHLMNSRLSHILALKSA